MMTKFSVDYTDLENGMSKKTYKYEQVKDRLQKVAFDIVRFNPEHDSTIDGLWKIEQTADGEVIVALYDTDSKISTAFDKAASDKVAIASVNNWSLIPDKTQSDVSIFYKNEYVTKISTANIGIPKDEVNAFANYMSNKLATNKEVASKLMADLHTNDRDELVTKFPELKI
jgi:predicted dinucleotide-binding enzyme